jgi:hypothetical protein
MVREGCSVDRSGRGSTLAGFCVWALFVLAGCSSALGGESSEGLKGEDVQSALRDLPFPHKLVSIKPPVGDEAAFRGVAHGKYGSTLHFSISVGASSKAVPIPRTRVQSPIGNSEAGYVLNDDSTQGDKFKTKAQWHAAQKMAVEIEESLCEKATDRPCPV